MTRPPPPPLIRPWSLAQEDAVEWLSTLPSDSANCMITDPAYESMELHRARGTTTRLKRSAKSSNDWFDTFTSARFPDFFGEAYRVLAPNSVIRVFCDFETAEQLHPVIRAAGFRTWKPWVWDKVHIGMGYHGRGRYELIMYAEKGKRRLHDLGMADVRAYNRVYGGYPTEKPLGLVEELVLQHTEPGELIIDPFFGSGVTGVAAVQRGRRFKGSDIADEAHAYARARLI